ncbi:lipopolysaccharide biosynthesis protein [Mesorhizobium marinum]|uniref:lipopolysaccharide biosynthesis protein n=1 Tax=Mesorhizobium marinum TaxID=3228790 RepID=UPI0034673D32
MSADQHPDPRASGLAGRLTAVARNPAVRGIAGVFVLKSSIIVANFTLIMLAARVLDTDAFGVFSILFAAAGLFCIVATFGQQVSLMRWWNEYSAANDVPTLKGVLVFSAATVAAGCAIVGSGFFLWAASTHALLLASAVTLYMAMQAAVATSAHLVRTAVGVGAGDGVGNLMVSVPAVLYLAAILVAGASAEVSTVFFLFAAGAGVAVCLHVLFMRRRIGALYPGFASVRPRFLPREWRARSFKLWISNGLEAANQYLDVLIIGYLMSPAVAGAYFVTTRLANIFATASDTMHMFSTRHIPDLYYRGEMKQLNALLNSVAAITLAVVVAGMVVMLAGGKLFLMVFNEAYVPYYPALALLSVGTAAMAAAGPSGSILMLTGHEGRYLRIIALTVLLRAAGFFVLVPAFGIMGAVSATTISFVFMTAMLRHACKRLTGLDGSVLRLAGRRGQTEVPPAE